MSATRRFARRAGSMLGGAAFRLVSWPRKETVQPAGSVGHAFDVIAVGAAFVVHESPALSFGVGEILEPEGYDARHERQAVWRAPARASSSRQERRGVRVSRPSGLARNSQTRPTALQGAFAGELAVDVRVFFMCLFPAIFMGAERDGAVVMDRASAGILYHRRFQGRFPPPLPLLKKPHVAEPEGQAPAAGGAAEAE